MMAEAYGKMTGMPGVCFVTRGPGACNASAGVHIAMQDSTPMVLFVGQIDNRQTDRETFQEVDYKQMFGGLAKWVAQVDTTERLPEYIARAFRVAQAGRPGPVVLALPENVLSGHANVADFAGYVDILPNQPWEGFLPILDELDAAERPLVVVGGPHWDDGAKEALERFATKTHIPVLAGFRRQDYIDNQHLLYAGDLNVGVNPRLAARVKEADCILLLGTRFGDIETQGYTLVRPDAPEKRLLHVHADANELGRVYGTELAFTATAPFAITALASLAETHVARSVHKTWGASARADYEAWITPQESPGDCKQEQIIKWLSDNLPDNAIITNGAGNYAAWLHRYFVYKQYGTQLAPTSGSMGYGFPTAISASLEYPERQVVCLAGDGCIQMTINEMSTAVQHGAKPIVIVMNNGRYGTIRMHQEKTYPARVSGTELANPDYPALARAYGGFGALVETSDDFPSAFKAAQQSGKLAIIECRIDPEALSTGQSLSAVRAAAQG